MTGQSAMALGAVWQALPPATRARIQGKVYYYATRLPKPPPPPPREATTAQLTGRICVLCGHAFRPGQAGVVHDMVAGGAVYRHTLCPTNYASPRRDT